MNIKRDYSKPLFGKQAEKRSYGRLFFVFGVLIGGLLVFVSANFTQLQSTALEVAGFGPTPTPLPGDLATVGAEMVALGQFDEAADMFERALALRPEIILADEPTSGLDTRTSRRVLSLFRGIAESQKTTFLIVSHDPLVIDYVDTAYDLHDGKLVRREDHTPPADEPEPAHTPEGVTT